MKHVKTILSLLAAILGVTGYAVANVPASKLGQSDQPLECNQVAGSWADEAAKVAAAPAADEAKKAAAGR